MGRVAGKVALITGAARGQGRAMAERLAAEGADIVAVDACRDAATVGYAMASPEELTETVNLVEKHGRRVLARAADIRDQTALDAVVADALREFGRIDILCANAGIGVTTSTPMWELTEQQWQEMIDTNLTGAWHTVKAAVPAMIERDEGGSIILTSSVAGQKAFPACGHYVAAKHGVMGLMKTLANEAAQYRIRVNAVLPTSVNTAMFNNPTIARLFRPDLENPTFEDACAATTMMHALPIPYVEPQDIAHAVVFLASEEARYITGVALPVDGGALVK